MNQVQFLKQAKYLLLQAAWPDGAAELVFYPESVLVDAGDTNPLELDLRPPWCLVESADEGGDESDPDLVTVGVDVELIVDAEGGDAAERALIGSPRLTGQGKTPGRGLLEVRERVASALARLTGANGVRATMRFVDSPRAAREGSSYVVAQRLAFRAQGTLQPHYEAHRFLTATALGGGAVRLAWVLAPTRFDMFAGDGYEAANRLAPVVRRAAGSTPPASPTAGTGVTVTPATATTVDVSGLTPGTHSFALFAAYTESGQASAEKYSDADLDTVATVVVT